MRVRAAALSWSGRFPPSLSLVVRCLRLREGMLSAFLFLFVRKEIADVLFTRSRQYPLCVYSSLSFICRNV